MHNKNGPQRLIGEVQMFRIRVAAAEAKLELLREQARQAKRRRKEAKRMAQRARRQFRRSKADLSEMRKVLAKAEQKLFTAGGRALATRIAKQKRAARTNGRAAKKPKRPAIKPSRAASTQSAAAKLEARKKLTSKRINTVLEGRGPVNAVGPQPSALQTSTPNTPTYEQRPTN